MGEMPFWPKLIYAVPPTIEMIHSTAGMQGWRIFA
jgi:hypothetical protein